MSENVRFRDFTRPRPRVYFALDGEEFNCHKALPLAKLQKVVGGLGGADAITSATREDVIATVLEIMQVLLKKESLARFRARLEPTDEQIEDENFEPVDHVQIMDIIKWLVETYTDRPTEPSLTSFAGSSSVNGGESSTAGAPLAELTPSDSSPTHFLT